jgi:hypothetical protein
VVSNTSTSSFVFRFVLIAALSQFGAVNKKAAPFVGGGVRVCERTPKK